MFNNDCIIYIILTSSMYALAALVNNAANFTEIAETATSMASQDIFHSNDTHIWWSDYLANRVYITPTEMVQYFNSHRRDLLHVISEGALAFRDIQNTSNVVHIAADDAFFARISDIVRINNIEAVNNITTNYTATCTANDRTLSQQEVFAFITRIIFTLAALAIGGAVVGETGMWVYIINYIPGSAHIWGTLDTVGQIHFIRWFVEQYNNNEHFANIVNNSFRDFRIYVQGGIGGSVSSYIEKFITR